MEIESKLKNLVLTKYKSLLEFSKVINIPSSTLDNIFKRGIMNANIENIIKICVALNISADELVDGNIIFKNQNPPSSQGDCLLLSKYDGLNNEGKEKAINYIDNLISSGKYTNEYLSFRNEQPIQNQKSDTLRISYGNIKEIQELYDAANKNNER